MLKELALVGVISASAFIPGAHENRQSELDGPVLSNSETEDQKLSLQEFHQAFDTLFETATGNDTEAYIVSYHIPSGEYVQLHKYYIVNASGNSVLKKGVLVSGISGTVDFPNSEMGEDSGISYNIEDAHPVIFESFNNDAVVDFGVLSDADLFRLASTLTTTYSSLANEK